MALSVDTKLHHQLELIGLDEARRLAELASSKGMATRMRNLIDSTHDLRSDLPTPEDFAFQHAGLCQTCLPHSRPKTMLSGNAKAADSHFISGRASIPEPRPAVLRAATMSEYPTDQKPV